MMNLLRSFRRFGARLLGAKLKEDVLGDMDDREEPEHRFYRRGGSRDFRGAYRDLRPVSQDEQNRQAFKMFIENAFIRRIAKMTAEFVVGNGVSVVSKNAEVQAELDAWWKDPVNDWERRHYQLALEFPLYGEIIYERVPNIFTGRHRYNCLDPLCVAAVVPHEKYPSVPSAIDFYSYGQGQGNTIRAKILNGVPEAPILSQAKAGDEIPYVFYFRTNNLSGALRGHSNYYPLFEWADVLDNAAFTMGERMVMLLMYVWHLKAENLDAATKKTYEKMLREANPGSSMITGKGVELTAVTPDLKNADFTEGARFLRNLIAGAAGIPEHFMGEGGDVNRATAVAMNLPTLRSFLQQQREYVSIIRTLARANLVSVASMGRIPAEEVDNFTVQVDPMNPQDVSSTAGAVNSLVLALSNAKAEGWVTDQQAIQILQNVLGDVAEFDDEAVPTGDEMPPNVKAAVDRVRALFNRDEVPANGNGHAQPAA